MRKLVFVAAALLLLLVVAAAVTALVVDGARLGGMAVTAIESGGDLKVSVKDVRRTVSLSPRIVAEGLEIRSPRFPDRPLLRFERAAFDLDLVSLLFGPIELSDVVIESPRLLVPFDDEGVLYWGESVAQILRRLAELNWSIRGFRIDDLRATARHAGRHSEALLSIASFEGSAPRPEDVRFTIAELETDLEAPMPLPSGRLRLEELTLSHGGEEDVGEEKNAVRLRGRGRVEDTSIRIDVRGDNPLAGSAESRRALHARLELGDSVLDVDGTLSRAAVPHLDLHFGADFATEESEFAPDVRFALRDREGAWKIREFAMDFGDASASGSLTLEQTEPRPTLRGSLAATGLSIALPSSESGESERVESDPADEGQRTLFTLEEAVAVLLDALRTFDAQLDATASGLQVLGAPISEASASIELTNGRLSLGPIDASTLGGAASGRVVIEGRASPPRFVVEARCEEIETSEIAAHLGIERDVFGTLRGSLALDARGTAPKEIAGSTRGRITLLTSGGRLSDALAQLADMDIASAVLGSFGGDETTPIRCGVADFEGSGGVLEAKTLILDTGTVKLVGSGKIDVTQRAFDLRLEPRGKDFSVLSAGSPIGIEGPLTDPRVSTDVARAAATLLTPIELGTTEAAACESLVAEARKKASELAEETP